MVTKLGTALGTQLGTDLGTFGESAFATIGDVESYLARNLFSWMRADYYSLASGAATAFIDKVALVAEGAVAPNARSISASHSFMQATGANQVPTPTTLAAANNKEVAAFTGAHWYDSSIPAANWKIHSGTGWEVWVILVPTATAARILWSTGDDSGIYFGSQVGAYSQIDGNTKVMGAFASNVGTRVVGPASNTSAQLTVGALTTANFYYKHTDTPAWRYGTTATPISSSGASAATPTTNSPAATFRIGADSGGGLPLNASVADVLISNGSSSTLRTAIAAYLRLRYNA